MVRLGQNFLADPNLLEAIMRHADVGAGDTVLEVGAGEGVLSRRLAEEAAYLHVIEIDRGLRESLADLTARDDVSLHWADAMKADLAALDPSPNLMVANLPYAVATPLLLRTIAELPGLTDWTVMVQLEIAERLRAGPGTKLYGSPSVIVGWSTEAKLLRRVDRAVFKPRPRVDSALLGMKRTGPAPGPDAWRLIRDAFAHRRKSLARSVELRRPGSIKAVQAALAACGLPAGVRAEALSPADFRRLTAAIAQTP